MSSEEVEIEVEYPLGETIRDPLEMATSQDDVAFQSNAKGLIIVLHGFDPFYPAPSKNPKTAIQPFINKVKHYYEPRGYIVYDPIYPTNWSFERGARYLIEDLKKKNYPLNNVHMFGYSMGGLVCRALATKGVTPKSLTTYCSPNKGTALWVQWPFYNDGASSMMMISQDLANLNNNSVDKKLRNRYTAIGISYLEAGQKPPKRHYNDQLIEVTSAVMQGMNPPPGKQYHWSSYKEWRWAYGQVHSDAQKFPMIDSAFQVLQQNIG